MSLSLKPPSCRLGFQVARLPPPRLQRLQVHAMAPSPETIKGAVAQIKEIIAKTHCNREFAGLGSAHWAGAAETF